MGVAPYEVQTQEGVKGLYKGPYLIGREASFKPHKSKVYMPSAGLLVPTEGKVILRS